MTPVYFVRHGQSEANARGVYAGISNPSLTDRGRENARKAVADAKRLGIKTIVASDLARALETACIIADGVGIDRSAIIREPRLREVDVGQLTGKPEPRAPGNEGRGFPGYADFYQQPDNAMGVEYIGDTVARMQSLIASLGELPGPVLLVGHDMSGRVLRQVYAGQEANPGILPSFVNGQIVELSRSAA